MQTTALLLNNVLKVLAEVYLGPFRISSMERFYENSSRLKDVNSLCKTFSLQMFDRVLNKHLLRLRLLGFKKVF